MELITKNTKPLVRDTTPQIREYNEVLTVLKENLPVIMSNSFFKRMLDVTEKIYFLKEIAKYRFLLFLEVEKTYPEFIGKTYGVSPNKITEIQDEARKGVQND